MVDKESANTVDNKNGSDSSGHCFTDQDREVAKNALSDFNIRNYAACLQSLLKLEALCTQDVKLGHNKAVAEYFKSELRKTDPFRKSLSLLCSQAHVNLEDVNSLEDVDVCIFYYNHAILLFHLKQFATALHLISKVFTLIEPMEESLAQKVSMLLLELLLQTHQPEKALPQISYIEQQFSSTVSVSKFSGEKDAKAHERIEKIELMNAESDPVKLRLLHYRIRCLLKTHQLAAAKKDLSALAFLKNNLPTIFLRANLKYLRGKYRKAMRVLNTVSENIQSFKDIGEHIPALYYNNMGCVHHCIAKPNLSTFYFKKALTEEDEAMKALVAEGGLDGQPLYTSGSNHNLEIKHNLGVALLHAGQPTQAFDLLVDAVRLYHMNPRLWLRLAECCIMVYKKSNSEDFNIAHRRQDMVQGVVGSGIHKKIILSPQLARETNPQGEEVSSAIPSTRLEFASLCLRNALLLVNDYSTSIKNGNTTDPSGTPLRIGAPQFSTLSGSLSMASLGNLGGSAPNLGFGSGSVAKTPILKNCYGAPSSPLSEMEVESLRCSVLVNSAYVALCLGDYIMALKHAQELLKQSKLSGAHKLLGHLYAAEAFLMCNKISDAIDHLNPENIKDVKVVHPGLCESDQELGTDTDKDSDGPSEAKRPLQNWCPSKLGTARAVLQYNLAVAFATRGELDKAGETLKRVFNARGPDCEVPTHVVMLALYLELQLGHSEVSRTIVRQHCPQYK